MAFATSTFAGTESPLSEGGVWTTGDGSWGRLQKVNGHVRDLDGPKDTARYVGTTFGASQYSKVTISFGAVAEPFAGPTTRMNSATDGDCYFVQICGGGGFNQVDLYRESDNAGSVTETIIGSAFSLGANNAVGDTYELASFGSVHQVKRNGVLLGVRVDSTFASGQPGILVHETAAGTTDAISDWEGGDFDPPTFCLDTVSSLNRTGTTSPQTGTHNGAASGVKGVVIKIMHGTSATDHVGAGPVTYGGVALTRKQRNTDTATEPGAAEIWFLGSGVPQGSQTWSVTCGTTTDDIFFVIETYIGARDMEVIDTDGVSENAANPSVTLQSTGREIYCTAALYGGGAAPTDFVPNSNCFTTASVDHGAFYSHALAANQTTTADFAIGGTAVSDDVAYSAIAIAQVPASPAWIPSRAALNAIMTQ